MQTEAVLACVLEQERTLYRVAKTILRSDADCADAVQETMLKAIGSLHRLRDEAYLKTWLTRILINTCKDTLRKRKRTETAEIPASYPAPDGSEQEELYAALTALEEKLRLPLVLHYLEGFSVRDAARMLGIPEGTVKRRLFTARNKLRDLLTEGDSYNERS